MWWSKSEGDFRCSNSGHYHKSSYTQIPIPAICQVQTYSFVFYLRASHCGSTGGYGSYCQCITYEYIPSDLATMSSCLLLYEFQVPCMPHSYVYPAISSMSHQS
jgi:hypothetical protein